MKKSMGIITLILITSALLIIYLFLCIGAYLYPLKYTKSIEYYSQVYAVDKVLIASVINVESRFDAKAQSSKGAKGLMQIMDKTAIWLCEKLGEEYSAEKLFNPEFNIKLGTYYLSYLLERFDDLDTALASYNAGEGTVSTWLLSSNYSVDGIKISFIPYEETRNYVEKVHRNMEKYSKKFK